MRRPNLFAREQDMDSTMTPMIDVVFLLLVFFVWTASFQVIEYMLPSKLSSQVGDKSTDVTEQIPDEMDFEKLIIRITWVAEEPNYFVNDAPLTNLAELMDRIALISRIKADAPIIVHPDSEVPIGPVIEVYDVCKNAGFEQVSFAVNKQ